MTARKSPENLIPLIRETGRAMVAQLIERLHAAGYPEITGAHHPLFENIDFEGTRMTVLAARAGTTHQSMGELVQSLEARGYVVRRPDPADGRARLVRLTPSGRRLVRRALLEMKRIEREWQQAWRSAGFKGNVATVLRKALDDRSAGREK